MQIRQLALLFIVIFLRPVLAQLPLGDAPLTLDLPTPRVGRVVWRLATGHAVTVYAELAATTPAQLGAETIAYTFSLDGTPLLAPQGDSTGYQPYFVVSGRDEMRRLRFLLPITLTAGTHELALVIPPGARVSRVILYPALPKLTVTLAVPEAQRVIFPGEQAVGTVRLVGLGARPLTAQLAIDQLRLADALPNSDWSPDIRVVPFTRRTTRTLHVSPRNGEAELAFPFPSNRYGLYGATLTIDDGAQRWAGYLGAVAVVPYRETGRLNPNGLFLASIAPDTPIWQLHASKRAGVDWLRTEIGWSNFEPEPGRFDWSHLDPFFAACKQEGLCVMNLASHAPGWAQPKGTFADIPYKDYTIKLDDAPGRDFLPAWEHAWAVYLARYREVSRAITLWNEPWEGGGISGWKSSGEHYRALLAALARARGAVDPSIKIVAADCSHDTDWKILTAGRQDDLDVISTHYEWPRLATAYAMARVFHKEVWETETWESWQGDAPTVRRILYNLTLGAHVLSYWHRGTLVDNAGNPTPELVTLAGTRHLLDGVNFARVMHPERPPFVLLFTSADRQIAAVTTTLALSAQHPDGQFRRQFADASAEMHLNDPRQRCRAYDLYGNPLPLRRRGNTLLLPVDAEVRYLEYRGPATDFSAALSRATYPGLRPVEIVLHDLPARLAHQPLLAVTLRNAHPTPLSGMVTVSAPGLIFTRPAQPLALPPTGELTVNFPVLRASPTGSNRYPVHVQVHTSKGDASLDESISVATIVHGTPDPTRETSWEALGATPVYLLPHPEKAPASLSPWLPWVQYSKAVEESTAEVAFASDDAYLYLLARVKDSTPRWLPSILAGKNLHLMQNPPADYVYREMAPWPERDGDSLEITLGPVTRATQVAKYEVYAPDNPLYRFGAYLPALYSYLLYPTRDGGAEVLRLRTPDFYYAHPLPMDYTWMAQHCRVNGATVTVRHELDGYVLSAALPWSELRDVPHAPGDHLRLNIRLRDATPGAPLAWAGSSEAAGRQLSWSTNRSIAGIIALDYTPCGRSQWSADTEWGFDRD